MNVCTVHRYRVVPHVFFTIYDYARIDSDSAFRLVVKVGAYVADGEYEMVDMAEQHHDIWFDINSPYSLDKFTKELA